MPFERKSIILVSVCLTFLQMRVYYETGILSEASAFLCAGQIILSDSDPHPSEIMGIVQILIFISV